MRSLCLLLLVALALGGCARNNFYNLPRETVANKVRVLGIAPIYTDPTPPLKHPEKDGLVALLKEQNRKNEKELAPLVRKTEAFFAVRSLEDDPDRLYARLLAKRERRDDAAVVYNKYFFKPEELRDYLRSNSVDAVLFLFVSAISRPDRVYSANLLSYLDYDYQYVVLSGQMVDADGRTIWEYPNFRLSKPGLTPLYALQYPDFDEAAANLDERVDVKYKTLAGIRRGFEVKGKDLLQRPQPGSKVYLQVFEEMASLLEPERDWLGRRTDQPAAPSGGVTTPVTGSSQPVVTTPPPAPSAPPVAPVTQPPPPVAATP